MGSRWHKTNGAWVVNLDHVYSLEMKPDGRCWVVWANTSEAEYMVDRFNTKQEAQDHIDLIIRRDDVGRVR